MAITEDRFSRKGLRFFYLCLTGFVVMNVLLLYGLGLLPKASDAAAIHVRMLMLESWWMVAVGAITFTAAYMAVAFLSGLLQGVAEPVKPDWKAVFVFALAFASVHSFRVAYGGDLPQDFITLFGKDLLGILLCFTATFVPPARERIYRKT